MISLEHIVEFNDRDDGYSDDSHSGATPKWIRQAAKTIEISNITDPILDEYVLQTKLSGNDGKRKKVQI